MSEQPLLSSSGSPAVDRTLQAIVGHFERAFPGLIGGYYLIGSYADASAVAISDIDLIIMFTTPLTSGQLAQAHGLVQQCAEASPVRLDLGLTLRRDLSGTERVLLKLGSRLVYGEDAREQLALPPLAEYRRDVTWSPYRFLVQVLRGRESLAYPLAYPDAGDPFYGYATKRLAAWYPAEAEHGTKELITGVARTATALLALRSGQYVGSKGASIRMYREQIGGQWADYLEALYREGKLEWQYAIPAGSAEQRRLRELCRVTLDFENHYFAHYRTYLLELLHGADDERLFAAQRLTQVHYGDATIVGALRANTQAASAETRAASARALAAVKKGTLDGAGRQ